MLGTFPLVKVVLPGKLPPVEEKVTWQQAASELPGVVPALLIRTPPVQVKPEQAAWQQAACVEPAVLAALLICTVDPRHVTLEQAAWQQCASENPPMRGALEICTLPAGHAHRLHCVETSRQQRLSPVPIVAAASALRTFPPGHDHVSQCASLGHPRQHPQLHAQGEHWLAIGKPESRPLVFEQQPTAVDMTWQTFGRFS